MFPALPPQALSIPVLANGNIRNLADAHACMAHTGCDGVLSAESLLEDPALFSPQRLTPGVRSEAALLIVVHDMLPCYVAAPGSLGPSGMGI